MLIKTAIDIPPSEITDPNLFARRRHFIQGAAASALASGFGLPALAAAAPQRGEKLPDIR